MTPESPEYCLLYTKLWWLCLSKAEWASWVQAVGSLFALGVAVWVVRFQLRRTRLHTVDDAASVLEARAKLLDYAVVAIREMEQVYSDPANFRSSEPLSEKMQIFRQIVQSFEAIGYETVTSPDELEVLMDTRRQLSATLAAFDGGQGIVGDRYISLFENSAPVEALAHAYRALATDRRRSAC